MNPKKDKDGRVPCECCGRIFFVTPEQAAAEVFVCAECCGDVGDAGPDLISDDDFNE